MIIYMPMRVEAVIAMQACARLGAVHSVVFGGFSAKSLEDRIKDAAAKFVITADESVRGGKNIPLKKTVDDAPRRQRPHGGKVVVFRRTGTPVAMTPARDVWWDDAVSGQSDDCPPRRHERRRPVIYSLHLRLHRQTQGYFAYHRRLFAGRSTFHEMGF